MSIKQTFWQNIELIQKSLVLNEFVVADMFELKTEEFKQLRTTLVIPNINNVNMFTSNLGITIDQLFQRDQLDLGQLRNKFYGLIYTLPAKYDYGKLSKSRTIINCLDFIEKKYGLEFKQSILNMLQIDPRFFDSPLRTMNINVITDLCNILSEVGLDYEELKKLGRHSYEANKETEFGQLLSQYNNVPELLEVLCGHLSLHFDRNFEYDLINCSEHQATIHCYVTEEVKDLMKVNKVGNENICATKLGVFESFPKYLGLDFAEAKKTKSLYQGDSVNEYILEF
ncbi:MAG: hypothetical protein CME62_11580 [Halobacteriovoraceae bacterium]|nr:hypothetical protein [Halobacteriovoraceae bacterium]|tara:strand:+ start:4060 stop:4911 length:852 start_codon:yes stop_codon:yes gene_type:complete